MSKRYPAVYRIVCQTSGECYVGSSAYVQSRKSDHWQKLRKNEHANIHLQRAFNKYGEASFIFEILERPSVEKLVEREQFWIDVLQPAYNIRKIAESNLGLKTSAVAKERHRQAWLSLSPEEQQRSLDMLAEGRRRRMEQLANGEAFTPEAIERIKQARANQVISPKMLDALEQGRQKRLQSDDPRLRQPRLGMTNSEETRYRQSLAAKDRKHSEATKLKQSERKRGVKQSEEHIKNRSKGMLGHTVSEEARYKSSEGNKAFWASLTEEERQVRSEKARNRPPISEATRLEMSLAKKGKKQSPEAIKNRTSRNIGSKRSEEARANMRAAQQALAAKRKAEQPEKPAPTKTISASHKERISQANKAHWARRKAAKQQQTNTQPPLFNL